MSRSARSSTPWLRVAILVVAAMLGGISASAQSITPMVLNSAAACTPPNSSTSCAIQNSAMPSTQLVVNGGPVGGVPAWSISSGTAPSGVGVNPASGLVSGTPTQGGLFTFTISATFGAGGPNPVIVSQSYMIAVNAGQLTITGPQVLPAGTVGVQFTPTPINATGGVPFVGGAGSYQWAFTSQSQPDGLTIDPNLGIIAGTPINAGTFTIIVGAIDAEGNAAVHLYTLNVAGNNTLSITTTSLPGGIIGTSYSQTVQETGGPATGVTWSLASGSGPFPPGLGIGGSTGTISGTPTTAGSYTFTVMASYTVNSASPVTVTATQSLTIVINTQLTMSSPSAVTGILSQQISMQFSASGGATPYAYSLQSGNLPPGTTLNATSGLVSGAATSVGTYNFTIQVTDSSSQVASATGAITITALTISSVTITPGGTVTAAGQPAVTVTIGSAPTAVVNGKLTVTFIRSDGNLSQEVGFVTGASGSTLSSTATFTIAAGATQAAFANGLNLITGTVAGNGTITATFQDALGNNLTPSPTPTTTFTVLPTGPVIKSTPQATLTCSGTTASTTYTAVFVMYSSTLDVTSATFTLTATSGINLTTSGATGTPGSMLTLTVPLSSAFTAWYGNPSSNVTGSQAMVTIPITVSGAGTSNPFAAATFTVTNSKGVSVTITLNLIPCS